MKALRYMPLVAGLLVTACGSPEGFESGLTRADTFPYTGHLHGTAVGCSETEACSAELRALDGGTRAMAVVWMPRGCYHQQTSIIAGADGKTFDPRPAYVRPAVIELSREDLGILANGGIMVSTFDGCPANADGVTERAEKISFPADQLRETNARLVDPIDYDAG